MSKNLTIHALRDLSLLHHLSLLPPAEWGFGAYPPHEHHCYIPELPCPDALSAALEHALRSELDLWAAELGPRFRMYITRTGGSNSVHTDSMLTWGTRRTFRVGLLYVTGCEGGRLLCDSEQIAPAPGKIVTFPVRLPHSVSTVTKGERRVVRFDIIR